MDIHTRQGKYVTSQTHPQTLPTTLGIEGVGMIEAIGGGVEGFQLGDMVAYCLSWGSYAEFAIVDARRVVRVPKELPLELATASMFHGLTAHYLAYDLGKFGPGVSCLLHAASGGIGQLLVHLGARMGATVYATTSTEAKAAVARNRGATAVFLYDEGRFVEMMRSLTGGRGVDVVFDAVSKPTFRDSLRATRSKGLVVSYGSVGGAVKDLDPIRTRRSRLSFPHGASPRRLSHRRGDDPSPGERHLCCFARWFAVDRNCGILRTRRSGAGARRA